MLFLSFQCFQVVLDQFVMVVTGGTEGEDRDLSLPRSPPGGWFTLQEAVELVGRNPHFLLVEPGSGHTYQVQPGREGVQPARDELVAIPEGDMEVDGAAAPLYKYVSACGPLVRYVPPLGAQPAANPPQPGTRVRRWSATRGLGPRCPSKIPMERLRHWPSSGGGG